MSSPSVSVIIPVHNRPAGVRRAVDSVRAQTGVEQDSIEIVVVDDASDTPISVEGCRPFRLDVNGGPARARNAGVAASSGEIIAFLDSDDLWTPEKLERQLKALETLPDLAALACGYLYPSRGSSASFHSRLPIGTGDLDRLAGGCWSCPGSTLILRRAVFERVGPFDEAIRRLEDLDWQIRLGQLGGSLHADPVIGAVIKPGSGRGLAPVAQAAGHLARKFGPDGENPLPASSYCRLQAYLALERAVASRSEGLRFAAVSNMLRSLAYVPRASVQVRRNWTSGPAITSAQSELIGKILEPLPGEE